MSCQPCTTYSLSVGRSASVNSLGNSSSSIFPNAKRSCDAKKCWLEDRDCGISVVCASESSFDRVEHLAAEEGSFITAPPAIRRYKPRTSRQHRPDVG